MIELREKTLPDTARYAFSLVNSSRIISSYGKVLKSTENVNVEGARMMERSVKGMTYILR